MSKKLKDPLKIFHFSAECYPVAKVGGLADVVGALPKYQNKLGHQASVIMPWYNRPFVREHAFENVFDGIVALGHLHFGFQVLKETKNTLGFELFLIKIDGLTDREKVYGYKDADLQFIAFQTVALYWMRETGNVPDIMHCHDHHTGLMPFMLKYCPEFESIRHGVHTVGTIHNGRYQGWMSWDKARYMPAFDTADGGLLDWDSLINPLAAMVKCSDAYTTVSEGYLNELFQDAGGLESLFRQESEKAYGIVNGIDTEVWNPQTDDMISNNYTPGNYFSNKRRNKKRLCDQFGLDDSLPLVSFIGRFATEKGADLLPGIIERMIIEQNGEVSFLVLGSGDEKVENRLKDVQYRFSGNFALELGYNEPLSHMIYAGSDFLLMPSRVEPCGLNQMYAMTYGTLPIVRKIGGLSDTVPDVSEKNGRGFQFNDADENGACWAIRRALEYEQEGDFARKLRRKNMRIDFSWEKSTEKYIDLYRKLKSQQI